MAFFGGNNETKLTIEHIDYFEGKIYVIKINISPSEIFDIDSSEEDDEYGGW